MRGRFRSRLLLLLLLLLDVHGRSGRARRNFLALQVEWLLAQATLGGILDFGGLCGDFKVFGGTQRCVFELSIRNDKYEMKVCLRKKKKRMQIRVLTLHTEIRNSN